jgi:hypothetical protein
MPKPSGNKSRYVLGKGDLRRPAAIPDEEFEERWNFAFGISEKVKKAKADPEVKK